MSWDQGGKPGREQCSGQRELQLQRLRRESGVQGVPWPESPGEGLAAGEASNGSGWSPGCPSRTFAGGTPAAWLRSGGAQAKALGASWGSVAASSPSASRVETSPYLCPGLFCVCLSNSWASSLFSLDGVSVPIILGTLLSFPHSPLFNLKPFI